jgi:predicted Zn-dependent protease
MEPYAGPALLSGVAAGLLFHEAIGHRLEGERFLSRNEGHTFAGKLGKRILPPGVDLVDDPSLARHSGIPLFGHYDVDDECVPAQRVELVKDGVLANFLLSRNGAPGFSRSNGHGRHERFQNTMARMGNLVLSSREKHTLPQLKQRLIEETRARGLPFGIYVKHAASGETSTSSDHYEFQAFKGNPTEVYTVDAVSGAETRVRDVSFIGTPLAALQHILAFGGADEVDNSYCFAESGSVPVGTVAPSMLVGELELQRSNRSSLRPPTLPMPRL